MIPGGRWCWISIESFDISKCRYIEISIYGIERVFRPLHSRSPGIWHRRVFDVDTERRLSTIRTDRDLDRPQWTLACRNENAVRNLHSTDRTEESCTTTAVNHADCTASTRQS